MQRRTFLKTSLALAGATALGLPHVAHAKRKPEQNPSLKGYCVNNEWTPLNRMLSPRWGLIGWGAWLAKPMQYTPSFKWAIALYDYDASFEMNAENMAAVMAHPHYDGWWVLLREPDLNNTVDEAAGLVNAQVPLILSYDPQARFCVSIGTGQNPVYRDGSYGKALWAAIDSQWKSHIQAKGVTYYPYDQAPQLQKFLKQTNGWKPERELWVLEYGIGKGIPPTVTIDGSTPFTVTTARQAMWDNGVARDSWYAMQDKPGTVSAAYECLLDPSENFTATGVDWYHS